MKNWILPDFSDLHIAVVGDVMIDTYLWGNVERISPEAPVPVVHERSREHRLGGAANVALNISTLHATAHIIAPVGKDMGGDILKKLFQDQKIDAQYLVSLDRPTTEKTRILAKNHQLLRIDNETTTPLSQSESKEMITQYEKLISNQKIDVCILQDYNKGALTQEVIAGIISLSQKNNIKIAVDPKKDHFFDYKEVDLFKPNFSELIHGLNIKKEEITIGFLKNASAQLRSKINHKVSMFTLSEKGIFMENQAGEAFIDPSQVIEVSDVSGAGDTVISVAALCMALDMDHKDMAYWCNKAASIVCSHVGVVPILYSDLAKV